MHFVYFFFSYLGVPTLFFFLESVNGGSPAYNHSYIQEPCDNSRNFTLGASGYQRYGYIEADNDGCYNPYSDCRIRLSVSSGYQITVRFDWISIEISDYLIIDEAAMRHPFQGYNTPPYSIYSTQGWMNLQLLTYADVYNCLGGFRLYYTSFHYGECSENEFRCSFEGRCIPNELVCDSNDNCGDWSDEMNGTCSGLSTTTVTDVTPPESVKPVYDYSYIQEPCDNSRNFTLGANGYQRYGYIEADSDGCYNQNSYCRMTLSVSPGYHITVRFQWIAMEISDYLVIVEANKTYSIQGYTTPYYSIYSATNWMNLTFITYTDAYNCTGGFRLYYTSFHYGECSENEFRCSLEGRCIPNEVVCDSNDNCGDWSDELSGTCPGLNTSTGFYDHKYIQAPCDNSRNFTLGANGYQRYGIIEADDDGCYNPYSDCRIRLSASSGFYITMRFDWIAIETSDALVITDGTKQYSILGFTTPTYSIDSNNDWLNLQFGTGAVINNRCLGGFRLYYTSFHLGECSENEFRCSLEGRCIPKEVVCDYNDNCGDGSDEIRGICGGVILKAEYHLLMALMCSLILIAGL